MIHFLKIFVVISLVTLLKEIIIKLKLFSASTAYFNFSVICYPSFLHQIPPSLDPQESMNQDYIEEMLVSTMVM